MSSKTISFSVSKDIPYNERLEHKEEFVSRFDDYEIVDVLVTPNEVAYSIIEKNGSDETRCKAVTNDGDRCKRMTSHESGYCYQHR